MFGALGAPSRFLVYNVAIPFLLTKYLNVGIFGSRIMTMMMWLTVLCILRVFYSIFLYPEYFSRFRHIPTPKVGNNPPYHREITPLAILMDYTVTRNAHGFGETALPTSLSL